MLVWAGHVTPELWALFCSLSLLLGLGGEPGLPEEGVPRFPGGREASAWVSPGLGPPPRVFVALSPGPCSGFSGDGPAGRGLGPGLGPLGPPSAAGGGRMGVPALLLRRLGGRVSGTAGLVFAETPNAPGHPRPHVAAETHHGASPRGPAMSPVFPLSGHLDPNGRLSAPSASSAPAVWLFSSFL